MVGSIDPRCETVRGTHWPKKVAWLFGARVAETILASDPLRPHQQAGHMDASDPIRPEKLLRHGGRPHMGPGVRRDDVVGFAPGAGATAPQRRRRRAMAPAMICMVTPISHPAMIMDV